jgi:hypothetical protein
MNLPDDFTASPYRSGDTPDWHAAILRLIADQLGRGSDAYFPLRGAANKLEMYRRGDTYAAAVLKEGGSTRDAVVVSPTP